jgi:hypothetical protein
MLKTYDIISFHARDNRLRCADHELGVINQSGWETVGYHNGFRLLKPSVRELEPRGCGIGMAFLISEKGAEQLLSVNFEKMQLADDCYITWRTNCILVYPSIFLHDRSQGSLLESK